MSIQIESMTSSTTTILLCTFCVCLLSGHCCAADHTIISDQNNGILVSPQKKFVMGFFSLAGISDNRKYLGIWYYMDTTTIVWVANRDKPLTDTSGQLIITNYGNLQLKDRDRTCFDTELHSSETQYNRTLKLSDTGNAVLMDNQTENILWQSFDHPTDTFLPGMKMNKNLALTSWKSQDDPAPGNFNFQQNPDGNNRYVILKESEMTKKTEYWKGGSASSFNPAQIFERAAFLLTDYRLSNLSDQHYLAITGNSRLVMNYLGEIQFFSWNETVKNWDLLWSEPKDNCSVHNACGPFTSCNSSESGSNRESMCKCLRGFEDINPDNSGLGDSYPGVFQDGCKRQSEICRDKIDHYEFWNLTITKVGNPGSFLSAESEDECKKSCHRNCHCQAYSYSPGDNVSVNKRRRRDTKGCWIWNSTILDLEEGPEGSGRILSIRVANSTAEHKQTPSSLKPLNIVALITLAVLLLCGVGYIFYRMTATKRRENSIESNQRNLVLQLTDSERRAQDFLDLYHTRKDDTEGIDVPFFELESVLAATDNFSDAHKLGQGGFGPVYKGKLPKGLEIAVKRLSSLSGQGSEEFKNEVVLIAKLQHRNLVRLLGYCMKGNEKMLLYEYMPNKSLDAFIFDRNLSISLDWTKRFNIILGIARGLLYLHQDSRLRIIHRDLKTSNILLDEDMNPKISDFGLAKIVKGKDMEASTNRVIGTYGYMSPEYALDGLFSDKSDVFSFGVVVLEIISGKKNTGFYQSQNLLGYAWRLWKENKPFEFMDQILVGSCNLSEVRRCIIVALLCVQEDPNDRPAMTKVVWTLSSETTTPPSPKQPAFVARKDLFSSSSSSSYKPETQTNNRLTFSTEGGR